MTGRLDGYFRDRVKDMAFVELALGALGGLLDGVPVPLDAKDVRDSAEKGLDAGRIAKNMVKVIGCDPSFPYAHSYVGFIRTAFDEKLISTPAYSSGRPWCSIRRARMRCTAMPGRAATCTQTAKTILR